MPTEKYCTCRWEWSACQTAILEPGPGPGASREPHSMSPGASGCPHTWDRRCRTLWREKQRVYAGPSLGSVPPKWPPKWHCHTQLIPNTRGGLRKIRKRPSKAQAPWDIGPSWAQGNGGRSGGVSGMCPCLRVVLNLVYKLSDLSQMCQGVSHPWPMTQTYSFSTQNTGFSPYSNTHYPIYLINPYSPGRS